MLIPQELQLSQNKNGKGVQIVRNWRSPVAIWLACIELIFRELQ